MKNMNKAGTVILSVGIAILLVCTLYMIANLSVADHIITRWFIVMIAGVFCTFVGAFYKYLYRRSMNR